MKDADHAEQLAEREIPTRDQRPSKQHAEYYIILRHAFAGTSDRNSDRLRSLCPEAEGLPWVYNGTSFP